MQTATRGRLCVKEPCESDAGDGVSTLEVGRCWQGPPGASTEYLFSGEPTVQPVRLSLSALIAPSRRPARKEQASRADRAGAGRAGAGRDTFAHGPVTALPSARHHHLHSPRRRPATGRVNGASTRPHLAAMAPSSGLQPAPAAARLASPAQGPPPLPFARSATAPGPLRTLVQAPPDRSRLAPDDAFLATSPPRRLHAFEPSASASGPPLSRHLRMRSKDTGSRSRSRRRKRAWKKLLWVKQSCKSADVGPLLMCALAGQRLIVLGRPGQLHRPSDLSREPAAESSPETLRLLAPGR